MMRLRRGAILAITLIGLFGVAAGFALLALDGWPNEHLSEPPFVEGIRYDDWGAFQMQGKQNPALINAIQKKIRPNATAAELVSYLGRQGFRAGTPWQNSCPRAVLDWIRGCADSADDLEDLTGARSGKMFYSWGNGACANTIYVTWDRDAHGRARKIGADYAATCL